MAVSVIIAEPSYLLKRGISVLIADVAEAEVIFIENIRELNNYLDMNTVHAVFINVGLLNDQRETGLFFQMKGNTRYIALADEPGNIEGNRKFDAVLDRNAQKDDVVPLIERFLLSKTERPESKDSLLSPREQEVLKQVALGYTNQEIASRLYISKHTVISHRKNLTFKLGIKTVSGLTVYAILNGIIPKDQIR